MADICLQCGNLAKIPCFRSFSDFEDSAEAGCHGCVLIRDVFKHCVGLSDTAQTYWGDMLIYNHTRRGVDLRSELVLVGSGYQARISLSIASGTGNSWNLPVYSPFVAAGTSLPTTILQVSAWLDDCTTNHSTCSFNQNETLPKRVLDVGTVSNPVMKLCDTQGQKGSYVSLSYCWGSRPFFKTTTETFESHQRGVDLESLPPVLVHAIKIVRGLQIRYLWVDALCIVQDSKTDWETESSQMANIYQNSYLVIAATNACSVYENPLCQIVEIKNGPLCAQVVSHIPQKVTPLTKSHYPLLTRGWAHQEIALAHRVLHLGPQEVFWECDETSCCECGWNQRSNLRQGRLNISEAIINANHQFRIPNYWRRTVEEYCQRSLTFPTDRLPGISGIAQLLRSSRTATYLAGCWSDSLTFDILWKSEGSDPPARAQGSDRAQDTSLKAPSWSWASVNTSISYPAGEDTFESHSKCHCTVEDFGSIQDGASLTGNVSSGWIRLRTAILQLRMDQVHLYLHYGRQSSCICWFNHGQISGKGAFYFNSDARTRSTGDVYIFRMLDMGGWSRHIVARCVNNSDQLYERIGLLETVSGMGGFLEIPWPEAQSIVTLI